MSACNDNSKPLSKSLVVKYPSPSENGFLRSSARSAYAENLLFSSQLIRQASDLKSQQKKYTAQTAAALIITALF